MYTPTTGGTAPASTNASSRTSSASTAQRPRELGEHGGAVLVAPDRVTPMAVGAEQDRHPVLANGRSVQAEGQRHRSGDLDPPPDRGRGRVRGPATGADRHVGLVQPDLGQDAEESARSPRRRATASPPRWRSTIALTISPAKRRGRGERRPAPRGDGEAIGERTGGRRHRSPRPPRTTRGGSSEPLVSSSFASMPHCSRTVVAVAASRSPRHRRYPVGVDPHVVDAASSQQSPALRPRRCSPRSRLRHRRTSSGRACPGAAQTSTSSCIAAISE